LPRISSSPMAAANTRQARLTKVDRNMTSSLKL
jgi:hypothetical protein